MQVTIIRCERLESVLNISMTYNLKQLTVHYCVMYVSRLRQILCLVVAGNIFVLLRQSMAIILS